MTDINIWGYSEIIGSNIALLIGFSAFHSTREFCEKVMVSGSTAILTSVWSICRCDAEMQSLDGLTDLTKVVCHLLVSVLTTHIRDIFAWKNPTKWRHGQIHRLFLSFYPVSIAVISNHHETLLTRFSFDVSSPTDWEEQKMSDLGGVDNFLHDCTVKIDEFPKTSKGKHPVSWLVRRNRSDILNPWSDKWSSRPFSRFQGFGTGHLDTNPLTQFQRSYPQVPGASSALWFTIDHG
jgi:hypothetical protein